MADRRATRPERFGELDAYRGIAALFIVIYHAYDASPQLHDGGLVAAVCSQLWLGVGWFFTLSGFLIFQPFARAALAGQPAPAVQRFLYRRLLRIVPLYYVVLLLIWPLASTGTAWEFQDLLLHLTFTQIYDPSHFFGLLAPAWSLAVEVHFYILVAALSPLLCYITARLNTRRERAILLFASLGILFGGSVGHKWWWPITLEPWGSYAMPIDYLDAFVLGMAVAVVVAVVDSRTSLSLWVCRSLRLAGLALCGSYVLLPIFSIPGQLYMQLPAGLGFALILASTVVGVRDCRWVRILKHPVFVWSGTLSYGLYLWHVPLLKLLTSSTLAFSGNTPFVIDLTLLVTLSLLFAALSYRYVERPILQRGRRATPNTLSLQQSSGASETRLVLPN